MRIKKAEKLISAILLTAVLAVFLSFSSSASGVPYQAYNYNYWEDIVYTPAAYEPDYVVSGLSLTFNGESIGDFVNPQDICVADDGSIYLADTGNNRIVILDRSAKKVTGIIDSFVNDGKEDSFNQPFGVAVSEKGQIYIADSQNHRIVVLNGDGSLARIVADPKAESLEEGFVFIPLKLTVDYADRIYCVAQNMFEGIMVFETGGEFAGFFGTISVNITAWEKFWKRIATKEERAKSQLFIPTEFTGVDIDPDGFVYASNVDPNGIQGVRRLNPKGQDVIKKGANGNLGGDLQIDGSTDYAGPSQFADVVYRNNGIYSCLDRKRGRIFTYDHEGNLLYIFGGMGQQDGNFQFPAAIEDVDGDIVVLDSNKATITYFRETEYGRLINTAVSLRYDGDETLAVPVWKQVLLLDENNELANTGIGKAYLTSGDYKLAMKYLKLGMARNYYSVAFKRFRNDFLSRHANVLLSFILIVSIALYVYPVLKKKGIIKPVLKKADGKTEESAGRYLLYTLTHPMDGFYWIRHQEKGSVPLAILMVVLFSFAFTANRLLSGFVVNDIDPRSVDSVFELTSVLILFLLLCVSNWSVTCLMNGEGRLKDIAIAIGYGTVPVTVSLVIATIVSLVVADDEQAFYKLILTVGMTYGIILILSGIMQVHNYTLGKTLVTLVLTIAAFLVIVFLITLMSGLIGMVINFFKSIYTEIIFRT